MVRRFLAEEWLKRNGITLSTTSSLKDALEQFEFVPPSFKPRVLMPTTGLEKDNRLFLLKNLVIALANTDGFLGRLTYYETSMVN